MIRRSHYWPLATCLFAPLTLAACGGIEPSSPGAPAGPESIAPDTTVRAGPFTVESGADQTFCTYVRADNDSDQDITAFLTEQGQGGHHLIVYTIDHPVDLAPHPCSQGGQPSWAQILATQLEKEEITFPEGVGFHVEAHQQYVMETHFINTTPGPLDIEAKLGVRYARPGTVKERAATYFIGTMNIDIAPRASATKTADCHPPEDMKIRTMTAHQHRMGVAFDVVRRPGGLGGDAIYHAADWESPGITTFDGGLDLSTDDVLSVTCKWNNTSPDRLRFPHEMCFAVGYFWPADAGLFCATGGGDDTRCVCSEQGSLDSGPGGAAVVVTVSRAVEIPGAGGEIDGGAPIYCSLFRAEDYGASGPEPGARPSYSRDAVDVPLKTGTDTVELDIEDVTPGDYTVSCMMDVIGGGTIAGKGDITSSRAPRVTAVKGQTENVRVTLDTAIQ